MTNTTTLGPIARAEIHWSLTGYGLTTEQADAVIEEMIKDSAPITGAEIRDRAHAVRNR